MVKYFKVPFAVDGDLNTVPDPAQGDGTVSYDQGYPILYSTPVASGGKDIERAKINQIFNDVTGALKQLQENSVPFFITSALNGGSPFSYAKGVDVISGGVLYRSLINGNTDTPPSANWSITGGGSPVSGGFRNLKITVTSNTAGTITADAITLEDPNGVCYKANAVNLTYGTGTVGANGLDTGTLGANTWYYEWLIYNATTATVASLVSLSATAPTLPSGYTYKARVGAVRAGGSATLMRKVQYARDVQYVVGANPATTLQFATGASGSVTTPTYTPVSIAAFVPPTASHARVALMATGGALTHALLAPNASYGNITSGTAFLAVTNNAVAGSGTSVYGEMALESTNLYYAGDSSANSAQCLGWTDNL